MVDSFKETKWSYCSNKPHLIILLMN
jgi:hypothetical protein